MSRIKWTPFYAVTLPTNANNGIESSKSPIIDSGIVNSTVIKGSSKQGLELDKSSLTNCTLVY